LFHAAESKTVKCGAGEKISRSNAEKINLRNAETIRGERLSLNNGIQIFTKPLNMAITKA
jgi:hypothetical protein